MNRIVLGCVGAVIGAVVGVGVFYAVLKFLSMNALMVVGLGAGVGAATSRVPGPVMPVVAAVVAAGAMVLAEWWQFPFRDDQSLGFFISHLGEVARGDLALMALGVAAAAYLGWTSKHAARSAAASTPAQ